MDGRVLVAEQDGCCVLKLVGDVRLTACPAIDQFVVQMLTCGNVTQVVVDLTETQGMDSTTLGMLAKLALCVARERGLRPMIVTDDDSILKLIESMGFEQIYDIHRHLSCPVADSEVVASGLDENAAKAQVLQAHQVLMSLNQHNREAFKDLVEFLSQPSQT